MDSKKSMIIIGGGNSISAFPTLWDDLKGREIMSINHAYCFLKEPPKWQFSLDRKFWEATSGDMDKLAISGCQLIGRQREIDSSREWNQDKVFCGRRRLSGVAALSYAVRELRPERIFMFGYDFGPIDGQTHFYSEPKHSGIGKLRAYCGLDGSILDAVNDFRHFANGPAKVYIVGRSNITCLPKLQYSTFLEMVGE